MNTAYIAGIVCGLLLVLLVCWLISLKGKKTGVQKKDFDERQRAIRDRGFRLAYLTLVGYIAVYLFVESLDVVWCEAGGGLFLGALLSALVHVVYSIYNDAYFTVSESPKSYLMIFGFVSIVNIVFGILRRLNGGVEGPLSYGDMNLMVGVFLLIVVVNVLIKIALDKRESEI